ncbi:hypothetical protein ACE1TI_04945 [Alteribacillus sp. JSM 102045]|uniref:hypothetical protein n=1 Tax=Alteribacillus sp. JSM 102045 TaxID=1562101 RepID=UPI0035BF5BE5
MEDKGVTVTDLSEEEQDKPREKAQHVYENYREAYGGAVLDNILDSLEESE